MGSLEISESFLSPHKQGAVREGWCTFARTLMCETQWRTHANRLSASAGRAQPWSWFPMPGQCARAFSFQLPPCLSSFAPLPLFEVAASVPILNCNFACQPSTARMHTIPALSSGSSVTSFAMPRKKKAKQHLHPIAERIHHAW